MMDGGGMEVGLGEAGTLGAGRSVMTVRRETERTSHFANC